MQTNKNMTLNQGSGVGVGVAFLNLGKSESGYGVVFLGVLESESELFLFLEALFYTKLGLHSFGVGVAGVVYLGWSRSCFFRHLGVGIVF